MSKIDDGGPPMMREDIDAAIVEVDKVTDEQVRVIDEIDVTGWGVWKGHAIPLHVARYIAERINGHVLEQFAAAPVAMTDEQVIDKIMHHIEDVIAEAEVDYPASRESGSRIVYDDASIRKVITAAMLAAHKASAPEGWGIGNSAGPNNKIIAMRRAYDEVNRAKAAALTAPVAVTDEQVEKACKTADPDWCNYHVTYKDKKRDVMRRVLEQFAAAPKASAPEGWVMVPREPTKEMNSAAFDAVEINNAPGFATGSEARVAVYRAMLAAAPTPPVVADDRIHWFLTLLNAERGVFHDDGYGKSWISVFCDDREAEADTFNLAQQRGLTCVSHDSDTDISIIRITQSGLAAIRARSDTAPKGE